MGTQSNIWLAAVSPSAVPTPSTGYYALFVADGTGGTTAGLYYKKDFAGTSTQVAPAGYTAQQAQDAVGSILTASSTASWSYDSVGHTIAVTVIDSSITNAKLSNMAAGTFKMRAAGAGSGAPIDGTAAQAKTALSIQFGDVGGLGTAATLSSAAFDAAGAATAAQAASQPLDSDLTAIAALTTTAYGRALLTTVDATALTATLNAATQSLKGLMSSTDKAKLDNLGNGSGTYNVNNYGIATSNTGTVNLAAWDALMTAIPDNSNVLFPPTPSAYPFSSTLNIPTGKHLRIIGGGAQKSIIQTNHASNPIFTVGDWYNEFRGLKFTSSVTRTAGAAIYSGSNVGINVFDCDFAGMWDGIVYSGGANAGNLAIVSQCGFTGTLNRGIVLDGTNANTILEKVTMDGTLGAQQVGLELLQCGSVLVSNCDLIRSVNNVRFNPVSPNGVFSAYFVNTFFDTASGSSLLMTNTGNIQRVKCTNCWFSGSVNGLEFASTATTLPTAIDLVNCDIFGNSGRGVWAHGVQDFSISSSRVAGNTTAGVEASPSTGSVTKFNIQNTTLGTTAGFSGNGVGVLVNAGTYGSYTITGNDVRGNTTSISDAGSVATSDLRIIGDNIGHLITGSIGNLASTFQTSGSADTALLSARVPPAAVMAGQVFRFRVFGLSGSIGTLIFRVHAGANGTVADTTVWTSQTSGAQTLSQRAGFEGLLTVRTSGNTGTVQCESLGFAGTALLPTVTAAATTPTVNTTNPWFITLSVTCSLGTFTAHQAVVEAL